MVQLNLIPDVKYVHLKASRTRNLAILVSMIVSGVAIGILVLLAIVVYGAQTVQINSLNDSIASNAKEIKNINGIEKILTVQSQLNTLDQLHQDKPVTSRLYTFLPQLTPTEAQISEVNLKYEDSSLLIKGQAKDLLVVNKFVDTLKFTKFKVDENTEEEKAFNTVVLGKFSKSDKGANYEISLKFDPKLFSGEYKTVTLVVPKIISTRSESQGTNGLFIPQPEDPASTEGQQ